MALFRTLARPAGLSSSRLILHRPRHDVRSFSLATLYSSGSLNSETFLAAVPATIMDSLHWTGLPWFAVLPLSAVIIRSCFVYPVFLKPMRKKLVRRANIQPMIDASMSDKRREFSGPQVRLSQPRLRLMMYRWQILTHLERRLFNIDMPTFPRFFSFLTLITVSDAVRRLCGAKEGLLKTLMGPFDWVLGAFSEAVPPVKEAVQAFDQTDSTQALSEASNPAQVGDTVAALPTDSLWFEPGLLTEGLPWCTDLTAADPTFILPAMFSSVFFASIYFSPRAYGVAGKTTDGPPRATNLQRIGMTIATLSIIPALQMPCALLLYFIANIGVNILQARWLAYTMPVRQAPTACARPVRTQPLKEMKETVLPNTKRS